MENFSLDLISCLAEPPANRWWKQEAQELLLSWQCQNSPHDPWHRLSLETQQQFWITGGSGPRWAPFLAPQSSAVRLNLNPSSSSHTLTLLLLQPFQSSCVEERGASRRQCDPQHLSILSCHRTHCSPLPSSSSPQEAISLPIALVTNPNTDADFTQSAPVTTLCPPRRMKVSPEGNVAHLAHHHFSAV